MQKNKTQKNIAMKESGINWVGSIPSDWIPHRGKFLFRNKKQINRGMICDNVLSLTMQGVISRSELGDCGLVPSDYSTFQLFKKGDLVFKLIDLENYKTSRVGLVHEDGIMSSAYIRVFPKFNQDLDVKYFYYFYYNLYLEGIYNFVGMGVRSTMNSADLLDLDVIIPPKQIQEKIVGFLDEKTGAVAELVEKKKRMIELLKEKRSSLITHVVTKGLDKNVEMKGSGVDWIGEIPSDWEVRKTSQVFTNIGSGTTPSSGNADYYNGNIFWIQSGDLNAGIIKNTKKKITKKAMIDNHTLRLYKEKSIVIAMYGASVGNLSLTDIESTTNQACCVLPQSDNKIDSKFAFYYYLISKNILISFGQGGSQPNINKELIKSFKILVPNKQTQQKIVEFLDKETSKIDNVISKIQKQIKLLDEYKASLIYHTVTGKIAV